ncbi:cupin-like domain-containing protein [archaeon]|nr:MAG: cupin-like domain-containing protein [archaeon]
MLARELASLEPAAVQRAGLHPLPASIPPLLPCAHAPAAGRCTCAACAAHYAALATAQHAWAGQRDDAWRDIHAAHWSRVTAAERERFALAATAAALARLLCAYCGTTPRATIAAEVQACVAEVDKGIMMNDPRRNAPLHGVMCLLEMLLEELAPAPAPAAVPSPLSPPLSLSLPLPLSSAVECSSACGPSSRNEGVAGCASATLCAPPRLHLPSLDTFAQACVQAAQPAVLTGCTSAWPACGAGDGMRAWHDLAYLVRVAGHRLVPVEVGAHYMSRAWHTELMSLSHFIHTYMLPTTRPAPATPAYLAQHMLPAQVPALQADFSIPDYTVCTLPALDATTATTGSSVPSSAADECAGVDTVAAQAAEDVAVNMWLGPGGTVSCLHWDAPHNLLAQVFGRKRIRLYAPLATRDMYAADAPMQNTSRVDVECVDAAQFPHFPATPDYDFILEAGDMVYIPPGWWHHVRSLDAACSLSFWWR